MAGSINTASTRAKPIGFGGWRIGGCCRAPRHILTMYWLASLDLLVLRTYVVRTLALRTRKTLVFRLRIRS